MQAVTFQVRSPQQPTRPQPSDNRSLPAHSGFDQAWPLAARVAVWVVASVAVGVGTGVRPLVGAAAVVAVAVGLALLDRPVLAVLLMVAVGPAVSGLARGLVVPGARLSEVAIIGAAVLVLLITRLDEPPWRPLDWLLLAFAVVTLVLGAIGAIQHHIPTEGPTLSDLVMPFQFLLAFRVTTTALGRRSDRVTALRWVLWTGGGVAGLSIAQRYLPPVQALVTSLTGSDNYAYNELYFTPRATGPFPIWHFLGGYLLVVALLALALLVHGDVAVMSRRSLLLVIVLTTTGIVLTLTFAVLFGLILGYVVLAIWSGRGRIWLSRGLAAAAAAAIVASPLIGGRLADQRGHGTGGDSLVPQTLSFRWDVWTNQYFPAMKSMWVFGYGPGIPPQVVWRFTESVYITYLLEGGLVLVLLFLALNSVLLRTMLDVRDPEDTTRTAVASTVGAMVVVLLPLHAVFPYMTGLGLPQLFWALAGVALAGAPRKRAEGRTGRLTLVAVAAPNAAAG